MGDAVRGAGAGGAGGEDAVPRQPGKTLREKKKAGSKKTKPPDAENSPLNSATSAEPEAGALEGGIEGKEDGRDSDSEVVLTHGPQRAQDMPEIAVCDLNATVDKLILELKEMQHRATTAEAIVATQKESLHIMEQKISTSSVFQDQIMTMVNYAVGPLQAELEGKKAEMSKLYNALGSLNAQIAKANFDAKSHAEVRCSNCPLFERLPSHRSRFFTPQKAERLTKAWGCSLDELKKENRKLKEHNLALKSDLEQIFSTDGPK